ncbi:hypothetical protein L1049_022960 [Liquidambar formosana]|uniref:TmcB/TmcC TPR repeats domain-containing protein n=1 Tax=Liquidambar formosana TaxID=63359 RepID=A0AAP0WRX7_LIQFO
MKGVFFRSGSVPAHTPFLPDSPQVFVSDHDFASRIFCCDKNTLASSNISLHLNISRRKKQVKSIGRALSESDVNTSANEVSSGNYKLSGVGSQSFSARKTKEEYLSEAHVVEEGRPLILKQNRHDWVEKDTVRAEEYYERAILASPGDGEVLSLYGKLIWDTNRDENRAKSYFDQAVYASPNDCMVLGSYAHFMWEAEEVEDEAEKKQEAAILGFSGGGVGKGKKTGGDGSGDEDRSKMDAYYQEMLKSNPGDSLLLRNYGKFLHEVEKDAVRAEEYYERAILESPGDGEVLSLYGQLIWDTQRDENRAKSYFDQAVSASPND